MRNLIHFAVTPPPTKSYDFVGTLSLLLVASTTGGAASGRLLGRLVAGAAGRAASSGLLGGLVTGTTGRTASGRFLSGLVTSAASRGRSGCLRLLVPAKEIRKSHNCYLQIIFSGRFILCTYHFTQDFHWHKYALFYYSVTFL